MQKQLKGRRIFILKHKKTVAKSFVIFSIEKENVKHHNLNAEDDAMRQLDMRQ
jgi:hypothetical protein